MFDQDAHEWYAREAAQQGWSVRTLERYIGTRCYYRLLSLAQKDFIEGEMRDKTALYQSKGYEHLEFVKDPCVLEFLGFVPRRVGLGG